MEQGLGIASLKLLSSREETGNIKTFLFETADLAWTPGQFQTYMLPELGGDEDNHRRWFTIASAPHEGTINISTRVSESNFKKALNAMSPGDTIEVHGIEGDFTWDDETGPLVLVAGGIGATPYRSILLDRSHMGKKLNAVFLHFNRDANIPFQKEFEALLGNHPEFTYKPIIGETISADNILNHAPDGEKNTIYVSGAEPMVLAVASEFEKRGITIKRDEFPGYDEKTY